MGADGMTYDEREKALRDRVWYCIAEWGTRWNGEKEPEVNAALDAYAAFVRARAVVEASKCERVQYAEAMMSRGRMREAQAVMATESACQCPRHIAQFQLDAMMTGGTPDA